MTKFISAHITNMDPLWTGVLLALILIIIWRAGLMERFSGVVSRSSSAPDDLDGRDATLRDRSETDYFRRLQKLKEKRDG